MVADLQDGGVQAWTDSSRHERVAAAAAVAAAVGDNWEEGEYLGPLATVIEAEALGVVRAWRSGKSVVGLDSQGRSVRKRGADRKAKETAWMGKRMLKPMWGVAGELEVEIQEITGIALNLGDALPHRERDASIRVLISPPKKTGIPDLQKWIWMKRIRWAKSLYGRRLPELKEVAEKMLTEVLEPGALLRWIAPILRVQQPEVRVVELEEGRVQAGRTGHGKRKSGGNVGEGAQRVNDNERADAKAKETAWVGSRMLQPDIVASGVIRQAFPKDQQSKQSGPKKHYGD
ncbi:hypothetical protein EV426DRAFT_700348 [Tirmania nivea]|nr:hypothetical protein EV426DRAFT_700348 [Tirmania nivea]